LIIEVIFKTVKFRISDKILNHGLKSVNLIIDLSLEVIISLLVLSL